MTKRHWYTIALLAALCLLASTLCSCGLFSAKAPAATGVTAAATQAPEVSAAPAPTPTPKPIVTVHGMLPGEAPNGMADVLSAINAKLLKDISTQLDFAFTPADAYGDAVEAAASSGRNMDFFVCDSTKLASYAEKQLIAPLDEWVAKYGANITKNIDPSVLDAVKINGKLMGVPGNGGVPLVNAGLAFIYRADLQQKYNLPKPDSPDAIARYLSGIRDNDPDLAPLSSSDIALALMPALGPETALAGTDGSVAVSISADKKAVCVPVQDAASFKAAVAKAREWFTNGFVPKDIAGTNDPQSALASGKAASTFGSALSLSQMQQAVSAVDPGAALSCLPVTGTGAKYLEGYGGSALCVASGSQHGDSVVQFLDWVFASQANYDLVSYGVQGKNYSLSGERLTAQDGSYTGLPATLFTNVNYMRFPQGVPDDAVSAFKSWNEGAQMDPLAGFVFDGTNVSAQLASVKTVEDTYAKLLFTGSSDAGALLAEFGAKLKDAGQDKIVAEAQAQLDAFLSSH